MRRKSVKKERGVFEKDPGSEICKRDALAVLTVC